MEKDKVLNDSIMKERFITIVKEDIEKLRLKKGDLIEIQITKLYVEDSIKEEIVNLLKD